MDLVDGLAVDKAQRSPQGQVLGLHATVVFDDAGRQECLHKGRRAPIHDRRLGGVELDLEVVDSVPTTAARTVLHLWTATGVLAKLRLPLGKYRSLGKRRNGRTIGQIRAPKEDTRSGHGRPEREPALGAKMKTDSLQRNRPGDGTSIHPSNIAKLSQARDLYGSARTGVAPFRWPSADELQTNCLLNGFGGACPRLLEHQERRVKTIGGILRIAPCTSSRSLATSFLV